MMSDCEQDKVISAARLNMADSLTAALKIKELAQLSEFLILISREHWLTQRSAPCHGGHLQN